MKVKSQTRKRVPPDGYMCFTLDGSSHAQRSTYSNERREQVHEVRKVGACLRCQLLKKSCSKGNPCATCVRAAAKNTASRSLAWMDCIRPSLLNVTIYGSSVHYDPDLKLGGLPVLQYLAHGDVDLKFDIPFQWNIDELSTFVAGWLANDYDAPRASMVGIMSSASLLSVISDLVGPELAQVFKALVYTSSVIFNSSNGRLMYSDKSTDIKLLRHCGHRLLMHLDSQIRPAALARLRKHELYALFLLLLGCIMSSKYVAESLGDLSRLASPVARSASRQQIQPSITSNSDIERGSELVRLLSHQMVYVGQSTGLLQEGLDKDLIQGLTSTTWRAKAKFTWAHADAPRLTEIEAPTIQSIPEHLISSNTQAGDDHNMAFDTLMGIAQPDSDVYVHDPVSNWAPYDVHWHSPSPNLRCLSNNDSQISSEFTMPPTLDSIIQTAEDFSNTKWAQPRRLSTGAVRNALQFLGSQHANKSIGLVTMASCQSCSTAMLPKEQHNLGHKNFLSYSGKVGTVSSIRDSGSCDRCLLSPQSGVDKGNKNRRVCLRCSSSSSGSQLPTRDYSGFGKMQPVHEWELEARRRQSQDSSYSETSGTELSSYSPGSPISEQMWKICAVCGLGKFPDDFVVCEPGKHGSMSDAASKELLCRDCSLNFLERDGEKTLEGQQAEQNYPNIPNIGNGAAGFEFDVQQDALAAQSSLDLSFLMDWDMANPDPNLPTHDLDMEFLPQESADLWPCLNRVPSPPLEPDLDLERQMKEFELQFEEWKHAPTSTYMTTSTHIPTCSCCGPSAHLSSMPVDNIFEAPQRRLLL